MAQIILPTGTAPSTPASGTVTVYSKTSDKRLYYKDDAGTEIGPLATAITGAITGSGLTMATARLLGRTTASTGAVEEITVGSGLSLTAGSLTATNGASEEQAQLYTAFTTGGTSTAYTLTPSPATTANVTNQRFRVKFNAASGATPTLAVSGQTAKNLKYYDSSGTKQAITSTQVPLNWISDVEYDGTDWVVLQPVGVMTATVGGTVPTPPNNTTTFLRGDGTFAAPTAAGITLGTPVASTSGTSIDFTGIPSTAKRITINLKGVSTSGTSHPLFQIGDSGGIETTGYLGSGSDITTVTTYTTGFGIPSSQATNVLHGSLVLSLMNSANNTWAAHGIFGQTTNNNVNQTAGVKSTSATLDRVRITTVGGSDTFDAGEINISYE